MFTQITRPVVPIVPAIRDSDERDRSVESRERRPSVESRERISIERPDIDDDPREGKIIPFLPISYYISFKIG